MQNRSSILVFFFVGLAIGFLFAVAQLALFGLVFTKYPEPVLGFWGLAGGMSGILVAALSRRLPSRNQ
jgi:hypothetical protein